MKKWEDIKPCAHCGGTADVSDWGSRTAIDCIDCGACCQGFSTESAISIWNARTPPEGYVLVPVEPADIDVVDSFTGRFGVSVGGQEVKYLYDGKPHAGPVNFTFKADAERAAFIAQQAVKMVLSAAQQPIGGE